MEVISKFFVEKPLADDTCFAKLLWERGPMFSLWYLAGCLHQYLNGTLLGLHRSFRKFVFRTLSYLYTIWSCRKYHILSRIPIYDTCFITLHVQIFYTVKDVVCILTYCSAELFFSSFNREKHVKNTCFLIYSLLNLFIYSQIYVMWYLHFSLLSMCIHRYFFFFFSQFSLRRSCFIKTNNQYLRSRPIYILYVNIQLGRFIRVTS